MKGNNMSTNSLIGKRIGNEVKYIYCHWDGHYSTNGKILLKYYMDEAKVDQLIALGDISALAEKVAPDGEHSFSKPENDVVIAYHRDRGDELNISIDPISIFKRINDVSYIYLFDNGKWYVQYGKEFIELTEDMSDILPIPKGRGF
jgi:hypothetical protein